MAEAAWQAGRSEKSMAAASAALANAHAPGSLRRS
jgi:hypothetical protein